ncbi:glycine dehydrogenase (decarboxylating) alpha subunit [Salsuginibacillus halophilus]|uniref:Probable glycine dehydrogenase (decarboxylating) subunit 1 n=1 Tax=Salsuginibacillus halophilus TaxID=517424 RepID=A0A2P8H7Z4_9BACI|nr:aminomethyl-transferring glycine dehydrogenase subunit GcvPA [Salsuginibacillus halophilus]PSL42353.1 glycine dehydrogenase (decarboxylating) alpha subunit [Salsuginibacillus halophilus]
MYRYLPMTDQDQRDMLETVGAASIEDLFHDVPEDVRLKRPLDLPKALTEPELKRTFMQLAKQNVTTSEQPSFLGAGVYDHYIPSVVNHVISRSEFYTAYTPYQPEMSQGELQAIFEFQSMIAELTGMELANSSMYDGHTALAEAAVMASTQSKKGKHKIYLSETVHPEARDVLTTHVKGPGCEVEQVAARGTVTDVEALSEALDEEAACVVVQYPNFFGSLEDLKALRRICDEHGAMLVVKSNPVTLGVLTPPGHFGADIVVGDTQPFGIPAQYGGPHCGYFATTKKLMRKVPGRLVGETVDEDGKRGFVLTLQAREQHIRRDKATSNICSNQALNALASSVAMTALGKHGVKEMGEQSLQKAHYAKKALEGAGFTCQNNGPHFHEFVVELGVPADVVVDRLRDRGIIAGFDLGRVDTNRRQQMLICVTEQRTKAEIDEFTEALVEVAK